jgi:perosamine synthetase
MLDDLSRPAIPLSVPVLAGNERAYVDDALASGWIASCGRYLDGFEQGIADLTGVKHAIGIVNGTAALQLALDLLGVGDGDEVLVPTVTFIAPVNAVRYVGAEPVFMDCDEHMNMDPAKLEAFLEQECVPGPGGPANRSTGRPVRAVIPVHVFGNPCDMAAIRAIADRHGLRVVEDASQSLGSRWSGGALDGRHTGSASDIGVFSFNGNKIVTSAGGGMMVTDDDALAHRARYLSTQAKDDGLRYQHGEVGYNFRLPNMAAAVGLGQLEQLPGFLLAKARNFNLYREGLAGVPGLTLLEPPPQTKPNMWFYSLIVEKDGFGLDRDQLMARLGEAGIETRPVWYLNHMQKPYVGNQAYRIERAPWFLERVLNLPCSSDLREDQVRTVCERILAIGGERGTAERTG